MKYTKYIYNSLKNKYKKFKEQSLKTIKYKSELPFPQYQLNDYIKKNRESLYLVENWIDKNSFINSWFNYGVPDFIELDINKKINLDLTYSDVLLFLSNNFFEKVNYLEIGVSVGKNFFQIMNGLNDNSSIFGFDIEDINPIIERKILFEKRDLWETPFISIKKSPSSLTSYKYFKKNIAYVCGDVWDSSSWKKLSGQKFNVIFSDALHTPEAIQFEFEQIVKNSLLDENFIILWDDLEGEMEIAFYKIIRKYKKYFNIKEIYLLKLNGWIGEHERKHNIGIISNFNFQNEDGTYKFI